MADVTRKKKALSKKLVTNLQRTKLIQSGALDLLSEHQKYLKDIGADSYTTSSHLMKMKLFLDAIKQTESLIAKLNKELPS